MSANLPDVQHWGKYLLGCGARVWALQPRKNGPLELRLLPPPAPGDRWQVS